MSISSAAARQLRVRRQVVAIAVPVPGDEGRRKGERSRIGIPISQKSSTGTPTNATGPRRTPHEQRILIEPLERVASLCPHTCELRAHGELAPRRPSAGLTRRVRLVLVPHRVGAPRPRPRRDRHAGATEDSCATRTVPSGSTSGSYSNEAIHADASPSRTRCRCLPTGAERRARGLAPDHGAEPAVRRELGHEQLARPDVTARSLDEEAVPADRSLDDALDDARVLGRDERVVGVREHRMTGVDDRGDGTVVVAVEADDCQRVVRDLVGSEPDGSASVGVVMRRFTASGEWPKAAPTRTGRSDMEARPPPARSPRRATRRTARTSPRFPRIQAPPSSSDDGHGVVCVVPTATLSTGSPAA